MSDAMTIVVLDAAVFIVLAICGTIVLCSYHKHNK